MEILYFFENLRTPALDTVMLLVTRLGEETAFLVAALIVFWCVDKRKGYFLMSVGFVGTMLSGFLKLLCRIPRPWVLDGEFTIVEGARAAATGYSFPSGHSQCAVGTFGSLAAISRKNWQKLLSVLIAIAVPVSRMYLGVHTVWDVLAGAAISLLLILALRPVCLSGSKKAMNYLIVGMLVMALGFLLYTQLHPFPAETDVQNLASGRKNAWTMIGCLAAVAVVYPAEKKYVDFTTEAIWWAQLLKVVLGLGLVLLVKEGLRTPLELILAGHPAARAIRYFLVVLVAGLIWPMTFQRFSKLGET